jgi:NADH:ubiquinone oxidoreductase subunit H
MLYFGNSSRETRWVPFPVEEIQQELVDGHVKKLSEIDHLDMSGIEEYGAEALMAGLVDRKEKVVGWARDKYILFVGESP